MAAPHLRRVSSVDATHHVSPQFTPTLDDKQAQMGNRRPIQKHQIEHTHMELLSILIIGKRLAPLLQLPCAELGQP